MNGHAKKMERKTATERRFLSGGGFPIKANYSSEIIIEMTFPRHLCPSMSFQFASIHSMANKMETEHQCQRVMHVFANHAISIFRHGTYTRIQADTQTNSSGQLQFTLWLNNKISLHCGHLYEKKNNHNINC